MEGSFHFVFLFFSSEAWKTVVRQVDGLQTLEDRRRDYGMNGKMAESPAAEPGLYRLSLWSWVWMTHGWHGSSSAELPMLWVNSGPCSSLATALCIHHWSKIGIPQAVQTQASIWTTPSCSWYFVDSIVHMKQNQMHSSHLEVIRMEWGSGHGYLKSGYPKYMAFYSCRAMLLLGLLAEHERTRIDGGLDQESGSI